MEVVAKISNVSKHFGNVEALSSLSLEVKKGQAVALLGPNGAGKSTALSILQGLRQPTSGSAELFGHPAGSARAMLRVGVTPQAADFPAQVTPVELIKLAVSHFPNPRPVDELVDTFKLGKTANRQIRGFSGGEKRRVALALCFAGNPELVILDEPTTGLDAQGQKHFQQIAVDFVKSGGSLVLTSHYWPEIEGIADSITMIDDGKTVMSGAIADIKAAVGLNRVSFNSETGGKFTKENFTKDLGNWSTVTDAADETVRQLVTSGEAFSGLNIVPIALDEALDIYRASNS